ncbi:hypothetical protein B0T14DRAFT_308646 [Immersiella caudata]|uniref:Nephrocystin 3-like N-terminal domain-containing protein n=1 Tax=Immersiella caudata TaxID=314043 RepID=A0AA40BUS1_9PEZI|nr:hypothetical protein B0T14DRAFT_308646 [Immersiella caudata]
MSNLLRDIGNRAAGDRKVAAPTGGTCQWIWAHPLFQEWESRAANLLWVQAPPGFGKTVLSAYIGTHIRDGVGGEIVLRFHFRPNIEAKSESLHTLLWTLIHQLVSYQGLANTSSEQCERLRNVLQPWSSEVSLNRLWELLSSMLEDHPRYTIILDGLDECRFSHESEIENPRGIIDRLKQLVSTGRGRIAVFCRPRPDLRSLVKKTAILEITPKVLSADIEIFFIALFNDRYALPSDIFDPVLAQVRSQAQGSFQWVLLYIQHLAAAPSQKKRQQRIKSFPTPLSEAYTKILDDQDAGLDEDARKQRKKIFQAVLVARRTLKLNEITESHDLPPDRATAVIMRLCSPLIEVRDDQCVISTHSSVKDFFLNEAPPRYRFSLDDANLLHAKKALKRLLRLELGTLDCIGWYLRSNNELPPNNKDGKPPNLGGGQYLDHAAHSWADHTVAVSDPPAALLSRVAEFLGSDQSVFWGEYVTKWYGTKEPTLVAERKLRKWLKTLKPECAALVTLDEFITKPYYRVSKRFDPAASSSPVANPENSAKLLHFLTLMALFTYFYEKGDNPAQAFRLSKSTTKGMIRLLGPDHRLSLKTRTQEASAYLWENYLPEAIALLESLVSSQERVIGRESPEMWHSMVHIGRAQVLMNNLDCAEETLTRALEGLSPVVGEKDMFYISAVAHRETVLMRRGEMEKAVKMLKLLFERQVEETGPEDGLAVWLQGILGEGYRRLGEKELALEHLGTSYEYRQYQSESAGVWLKVDPGIALVIANREFGMRKEAGRLLHKVRGTFSREQLPQRWGQLVHLEGLLKVDGGDLKGAVAVLREYALLVPREDYNRGFMWLLLDLASLLRHLGRDDEASSLFHHIVTEREARDIELTDEPSSPELLKLAERALTLARKEDIKGADDLLKTNVLVWARERDLWCWETASPQAPDTAAMKPPLLS